MLGEIGFSCIFDLYESTETDYNVFVEKSVVENNQTDRIQFRFILLLQGKKHRKNINYQQCVSINIALRELIIEFIY